MMSDFLFQSETVELSLLTKWFGADTTCEKKSTWQDISLKRPGEKSRGRIWLHKHNPQCCNQTIEATDPNESSKDYKDHHCIYLVRANLMPTDCSKRRPCTWRCRCKCSCTCRWRCTYEPTVCIWSDNPPLAPPGAHSYTQALRSPMYRPPQPKWSILRTGAAFPMLPPSACHRLSDKEVDVNEDASFGVPRSSPPGGQSYAKASRSPLVPPPDGLC